MKTKTEYVPRVNQIDAIYLNNDIIRIIRNNLLEHLQIILPSFYVKIQPELDLFIQSTLWLGSVGKNSSTFGQQLLVLSYDTKHLTLSRLCLHYMLTVLPNYIKNLDEQRLHSRTLHNIIKWIKNTTLILSILNYFRFLRTGKKPTLIDYILDLDYISLRIHQRRDIGYKYLTRELLWGGFMEMLGLVLPIINFRKIYRLFKKSFNSSLEDNKKREINSLLLKIHLNTKCSYCDERPSMPHYMPCGHIYCYYCLAANINTDAAYNCKLCGMTTKSKEIHAL